jgi:hypothetical protein
MGNHIESSAASWPAKEGTVSASTIIDVALGISFVFALLSVIASAVTEAMSAFLSLRCITLRRGIERLLKDRTLTSKVYAHPLVDGLTKDDDSDPTYIPSDLFARALIDSIANWDDEKDHAVAPTRLGLIRAVFVLPTRSLVGFLRRLWPQTDQKRAVVMKTGANLDDFKKRLAHGKNLEEHTRAALSALVADETVKTSEDAAHAIATWFDRAMDSVTGWYKRQVQLLISFVALVLAVALNVDGFFLVDSLRNEAVLRESVAATVSEIIKSESAAQRQTLEEIVKEQKDAAKATPEEIFAAAEKKTADLVSKRVVAVKRGLDALTLPVGWPESGIRCQAASVEACDKRSLPTTPSGWLRRVSGWLFTAIAISLGAPFWFDLLNKLINLRSAAPQPPKTQPKSTTTTAITTSTTTGAVAPSIAAAAVIPTVEPVREEARVSRPPLTRSDAPPPPLS